MLKKIILTATIFLLLPLMALAYDYTQGCVQGYFVPGDMCSLNQECEEQVNCEVNLCFADECEEPLKGNSHYTGNNCIFNPVFFCSCEMTCSGTGDCAPSGSCWYECDEGYYYEEGECIFGEPPSIGYERTPPGSPITNPVSFSLTNVLEDYKSWNLAYHYWTLPLVFYSQCFTTNNQIVEENLELGEYWEISVERFLNYQNCTGDFDEVSLEYNEGFPIFEVIAEEKGIFFTLESIDIGTLLGHTSGLFDSVKLLILLAIGLPLAFYIIKRVIKLAPKER